MKIISTIDEDHHMHSLNFSDGFNTIDEIAIFAKKFGLKKITITDHSQALIDENNLARKDHRSTIKRWKNVHNNVIVNFGVEADLLDEKGNICDHIQNIPGDFISLSLHDYVYRGNKKLITQSYIKAIEKHHKRIKFICHLDSTQLAEFIDMEKIIKVANKFKIPLEFNCANHVNGKTNKKHQKILLEKADQIIVNSDAHTLNELRDVRKIGYEFLQNL